MSHQSNMSRYEETLYDSYGQVFDIDETFFEAKTEHQHLIIFQNAHFGRVMALDGIIQTTEKDEFVYHEMMAHVPIFAHGNAKRVLIIGGGDGGMLREVCKHSSVEHITQVEIDAQVVDVCRKHLPNHSAGCFDDERLELIIADGYQFVANTQQRYDVIISDSTDPIGPGEVLFTEDFYASCHRCLTPHGVLVCQNGVAYMQLEEVKNTAKRLAPHFADSRFFVTSVPTYVGGMMTLAWATDDETLWQVPKEILTQRLQQAAFTTRYYNLDIHQASFALPQYVCDAINEDSR